jgi:hypothetical protein
LRCPPAIAKAASHLKDSGGTIDPADENGARAILIRGNDLLSEVAQLFAAVVKHRPSATVKVVSRLNTTVDLLRCRVAEEMPKLGCPPTTHMARAIRAFRQGRQERALMSAKAAIELALLGQEGATDSELEAQDLEPASWKRLAVKCLLSSNGLPLSGNLYEWQAQVGRRIDEWLSQFCTATSRSYQSGKLKPRKNDGWAESANIFVPPIEAKGEIRGVPATTVHAIKGETHDCTILVVKDEDSGARMPSNSWWSTSLNGREERRIAYVAMTRAKGSLIVWMGPNSYDDLVIRRPGFVGSFENLGLAEAISSLTPQPGRS